MRRFLTTSAVTSSLALGLVVSFTAPAHAASPPSNDTLSGATAIGSLPFDQTLDTSNATTDSDDADLNSQCGAPVTNGSVWYSYTPASDGGLILDVSNSNFSAGLIVAEGGPGNWFVDTCGPGSVATEVFAGTTYSILAFSDTPGVTGGHLVFHAESAPPPPTLSLTVNRTGTVDRAGNALIRGTLTCTNADFVDVEADVTQPVGRFSVSGSGDTSDITCDGTAQRWSAVVVPYNGKFAGGKSVSFTYAFGCGELFCSDSFAAQNVKLSKSSR